MNRFLSLIAALAGVALIFSSAAETAAATKKKKPADDSSDDATTPAPKHSATPPLDLPLPAKTKAGGADGPKSATPAKKTADSSETPSSPKAPDKPKGEHAPSATVEPAEIVEFAAQPPRIQELIRDAVELTRLNLTYTFGSADPDSGGMDCSGTIYYLLRAHKFTDVPRDSAGQYLWTRRGGFFPVVSKSAESSEFKDLLPGDLMFWTGTYESGRDIPISHVMMYLGREKGTGKRIMFGSSDGRSYNGLQRWGVSVFDFKMPKAADPANPEKAKAEFVGFARVPGLRAPAPPLLATDQDTPDSGKKGAPATDDDKPSRKSTPAPSPTPKGSSHKKKKKVSED